MRLPTRLFLLESYVPRLDEALANALADDMRRAIEELQQDGVAIGWHGSFAIRTEETCLHVIAASDLADVIRLGRRTGVRYDHVVEVLAVDPCSPPPDDLDPLTNRTPVRTLEP